MMRDSYDDIFEAYYFDELSSKDKAIFEKRLKNDTAWAADYEAYRQIMIATLDKQLDSTPEAIPETPKEEAIMFAYLNGLLSPEMRQQVSDRQEKDHHYASKIAEMKAIKAAFEAPEEAGTLPPKVKRPSISKFSIEKKSGSTTIDDRKPIVAIKQIWRWSIAACILLLVGVAIWLINSPVNLPERAWKAERITADANLKSDLQNAYIDPQAASESTVDSILRSPLYQEAILAMINQKPEMAEIKLRQLLERHPNNSAVEYRLVEAILRQKVLIPNKVSYAIETMKIMHQKAPNDPFNTYLLALAYASDSTKTAESITLLKQLLATKHPEFNNLDNVRKLLIDLQN